MLNITRSLTALFIVISCLSSAADSAPNGWKSIRLHSEFYAEGAAAGDVDGDGHVDVTSGPFVYRGPDFKERFELFEPHVFSINGYSDNFFSHIVDVNSDGFNDVIILGFPGREARCYVNPGSERMKNHWSMKILADQVGHESPAVIDLIPGGLLEIVCSRETSYGYYQAGENPLDPWKWNEVSDSGLARKPFGHGMGVGDVNNDGRLDIIETDKYWEQPADPSGKWAMHQWAVKKYGSGGAQMFVHDFDGDGDQDIFTSQNAHRYGLCWFERQSADRLTRHDIMGEISVENPYGVAFSQPHALAMADIDGDGLQDIVTGKRWKAHNGHDPGSNQTAVLYWFRCQKTSEGIEFVPHLIDEASGVGVDVTVADLNADGLPDVVSANKGGLVLHFQSTEVEPVLPERWQFERPAMEDYVNGFPPQEAAEKMLVPDGFHVDLIAAEPDLVQPIAMCFDARGRIWVIEGHTYPQKAPEGEGKDRILILEDADADGSFESKKVFAEGINLASGIEIGFGGVWVGAAPDLLFYPDQNQDDIPDAEPIVLLDGWGYHDTHETLNSFTWGPDGWLYGCHGVFTHSKVGKPGAPEEKRIPINAGVWRYHPTRHEFEVFAHGSSNPWGVDFNEQGDWFITACVIPHLYHLSQGGRYFRQAGNHFNPYTYADITTIADHLHYGDGTFNSANSNGGVDRQLVKNTQSSTSDVGGGHAHCGLTIYQAAEFPLQYNGELFFHNLHGHRIVREHVEAEGSGYIGRHRPDFTLSQDHQQIGVGIMQGPDGALYTSDWHDPQTCHNRTPEVWNRTDGRLFRIRYGNLKAERFNLWGKSDAELVGLLKDENAYYARQAQRILQERAAENKLDHSQVNKLLKELLTAENSQAIRLRALWTAWSCNLLDQPELRKLLQDSNPYVRAWAIQFLGESSTAVEQDILVQLEQMSKLDANGTVRRYLASLLQRLPVEQRWGILQGLTSSQQDLTDRNTPLLVWYGTEPLIDVDAGRVLQIVKSSGWKQLTEFVIRRTSTTEQGRNALAELLKSEKNIDFSRIILQEMQTSVKSQAGAKMPASWKEASANLLSINDKSLQLLVSSLSIQFGDESAFPYYRELLLNRKQPNSTRQNALQLLAQARDPELAPVLLKLLEDRTLRTAAIQNLARFDLPETPGRLIEVYDQLTEEEQAEVLNTLVSRKTFAERFIEAMEQGEIDAAKVPAYIVRQVISLDDENLVKRLEKVWGKISTSNANISELTAKYEKLLQPKLIASSNFGEGRKLYETNCGKCHKLFGKGSDIGPDITGANRSNVKYLLENILDPNAIIGRNYIMTTFVTVDGRVINGLIKSENAEAVTIQTTNEVIVVAQDDIEIRKASEKSLMPEGQLQPMRDEQVLQLFRYLMSPTANPSPETQRISVPPPSPGVTRIEGEALVGKVKVTGGNVRNQNMSGFGPMWSGNDHLWWTGGKPGDRLTLGIPAQPAGEYEISVFTTTAVDYGLIKVTWQNQQREADLYTTQVLPGEPIHFEKAVLTNDQPLEMTIELIGKHPQAKAGYMVGIDRIEFRLIAKKP
ncbi:PVC-type heme-binding CxxCH protein [Rubinisphaera sp.]|uniref:PVC-type heme-binding CxxCH protein n=1 Tax=Rubinisphaera sp. TaxID=2024857 RepID=UPI000C1036A1|nr:PVC-type heme-binding CxxCH protein [Rubinisphaera sp.]MBV09914.1 cytochrome C [Rubinisphaera sp.]